MATGIMIAILSAIFAFISYAFWHIVKSFEDIRDSKVNQKDLDDKIKNLKELLKMELNSNHEKLLLINDRITQKIDFNHKESSKTIQDLSNIVTAFFNAKKNL